jgi:glycosyltransferase involved in cell wall biosynthesis
MKKVSIVIPVYNVATYLRQCMGSLLAQTYPALEIILVDDGSTDESGRICDQYAQKDSRVVVIHQENAGAANAKNAALDRVTGEYLAFMDSDDYAEPHWIETMVQAMESAGVDVVECDFDQVYVNRVEVANNYEKDCLFTAEEYLSQYLGNWTCSLFWNKLFRAALVEDIRFRRERRCIDDEFFTYKAVGNASKILRIPQVLYHYRQRASGVMASEKNRLQRTDDSLEILLERYRWVTQRYPKLRKLYLAHDVDTILFFGNTLEFTKETAKKFRKLARTYLKECFLHRCDKVTWLYVLRLQMTKPGKKQTRTEPVVVNNLEDYYA